MSLRKNRADISLVIDSQAQSGRRLSRRGVVGRAVLVVVSALLALAVAEILCRALTVTEPPLRFRQDVDKLNQFRMLQFARIIQADPELFWRLAPNRRLPDNARPFPGVISNDQGFREDHDVARRKPAGAIRLLFVGDSCTFGYGLKYTDGFVKLVEASLRAKLPGISLECINAGVPGYSLFQGWRFLETTGFDLDPDLVVLNFGWNDADQWDGLSDLEHYAAMQGSRPPAALRWSRLCERLWATVHAGDTSASKSTKRARLSVEEFRAILKKIRQSAETRGVAVLPLVWPMRENVVPGVPASRRTPLQSELYAFGIQESLQPSSVPSPGCVDLVPSAQAMAQHHQASEIFFDAGHATAIANQEFAGAIVARLEPWIRTRLHSR